MEFCKEHYTSQNYTFGSNPGSNFSNVGIANLKDSAVHFSDEKVNNKRFSSSKKGEAILTSPCNSIDEGSQDDYIIGSPCVGPFLNMARRGSEDFMQVEYSEKSNFDSPADKVGDTPTTDDSEGSDLNGNDSPMQIKEIKPDESKSNKKPDQSKYKNKPKELYQKAVQIYNYLKNLNKDEYRKIMIEYTKSSEQWTVESEWVEMFWELKAKQYSCFAELCKLMPEILEQAGDVVENFNCKYKDKISQRYFKVNEFESGNLFSWMLLTKIALVLLPEDPEDIELLPFKKSTVSLAAWLHESPMSQENKDLYRDSDTRTHLRGVMTEIYKTLENKASKKKDQKRLNLVQRISQALGTNFPTGQEAPRRIVRAVGASTSPTFSKIEGILVGKRSSSKAPKLSEDKTTKKVKKQRK